MIMSTYCSHRETFLYHQNSPFYTAEGAKNSKDTAHTDGSEYTRETPTHTVNTSRCLEATVKGWIGIKSLPHEK